MDADVLWQRYQDWLYYHEGLGFYLDVSRVRFDDTFVETMQPKFEKAFRDMDALEKGAIANPDENRMVGHYWLRDADLAPTSELRQEILKTLEDIEDFADKVLTGGIHPPGSPNLLMSYLSALAVLPWDPNSSPMPLLQFPHLWQFTSLIIPTPLALITSSPSCKIDFLAPWY
jgi:hypothetical protein